MHELSGVQLDGADDADMAAWTAELARLACAYMERLNGGVPELALRARSWAADIARTLGAQVSSAAGHADAGDGALGPSLAAMVRVSDAARIAGVDPRTVRRWCKAEEVIAGRGPDGAWLVEPSTLRRRAASGRRGAA